MPRPRPLTPTQAKSTLANRFGRRVDSLRQLCTKFGLRPYRCFLVWTKWTGKERGEGEERELFRREILPTPRVQSLDGITYQPYSAGALPVGTVKLWRVSIRFTTDNLRGTAIPDPGSDHIPEKYGFYYEIIEDGRADNPSLRMKFRLLGQPTLEPGRVHWTFLLERVSEDNARDGTSQYGEDR